MIDRRESPGLRGGIKQKLIDTKQKWAREGRALTGDTASPADRLPPGQRLVENWPVLDLGIQPEIAREKWELTIAGLVENPLRLDWKTFSRLPQIESVSDIHCVTTWSRYDNVWTGVPAAEILKRVRPRPDARFVILHSYDGYTTNVPIEVFADDDVLLAHSWQGEPLTREHGAPVRMIIPKRYFWKSAKWLRRIDFSATDSPGFWEVRGYNNNADPWMEERYS